MQITCPGCRASYRVGEKMRGRKMFCPYCGQPLVITGGGTARNNEGGPPAVFDPPARSWNVLLFLLLALLLLVSGGSAAYYFGFVRGERQDRPPLAQADKVRPLPGPGSQQPPAPPVTDNQGPGAVGKPAPDGPPNPTTGVGPVNPPPSPGPGPQPAPASAGPQFVLPLDALGKPERLAQVKAIQLEGQISQTNPQPAVPFTLIWDPAGRWLFTCSSPATANSIGLDFGLMCDGQQEWSRIDAGKGNTQAVVDAFKARYPVWHEGWQLPIPNNAYRNSLFWMGVGELSTLAGKGIQPSVVGDANVKGRPAVCVRPDWARDWKDAKLYFDRDTHLLLKAEWRGDVQFASPFIASTSEAMSGLWEVYFSDYRETDGIKHWYKVESVVNGSPQPNGTWTITTVRYLDKVDDALFKRD